MSRRYLVITKKREYKLSISSTAVLKSYFLYSFGDSCLISHYAELPLSEEAVSEAAVFPVLPHTFYLSFPLNLCSVFAHGNQTAHANPLGVLLECCKKGNGGAQHPPSSLR